MFIPRKLLEERLIRFLNDDLGLGDTTISAVIPPNLTSEAQIVAKAKGIVAGIDEVAVLANAMNIHVEFKASDGKEVEHGRILMLLSGNTRTLLAIERTALNLLSRMSGIATSTKQITEKIENAHLKTRITATRKTAPGLLYFDKKAVIVGGGDPHRLHLDDMILIKDNHIAAMGNLEAAIKSAKKNASFSKKIEVEVTNKEDLIKAVELGADIVMLDNFSPEQAKKAVEVIKEKRFSQKVLLEVSGGITAENILSYAYTGIDLISLGELTHSVKALDISMEIVKTAQE
jgi:nicotinate-nucleotide pyrophosphorylase (carboxylating)